MTSSLFAVPDDALSLSDTEKAWLAKHPVIRVAPDIAWPPFEWVDSKQEYVGIAADYIRLVESRLGVKFEVEKTRAWPEVVEAVKQRQLDVFSCVAKNAQREEYVSFTRPYISFPMVFITTQDVNYIDGVSGMANSIVGVVKDYATHEYLASNHPEINLHLVGTTEEGLDLVSQGKIDVFVDNIATATRIFQQAGLTNLKISGEMPIRYELAMAVRKDWPELVGIIQKALDAISDEQRKLIHNRWIGVRYEHGFEYSLLWKSMAVFIFILALLYIYTRKLSREVGQRKLAEQEANRASLAKSEFLSIVSHELRTPLTSIRGTLGLLAGGAIKGIPEQAKELLCVANRNGNRLSLLIDDILDIEKLLAGKLSVQKQSLDINELLDEAVTSNQGYAEQYGIKLVARKCPAPGTHVYVDKVRILQVLSNLVSNAIKYSPQNSEVLIQAECMPNKVRVSVTDQGDGVPDEFRDQLFTYFSQADSSDTRARGGTGLGLAISKKLIELHDGNIGYEYNENTGSRFYFELNTVAAD